MYDRLSNPYEEEYAAWQITSEDKTCLLYTSPKENYIDRMEGARLGIFEGSALENVSNYLVPQECGNRCLLYTSRCV